jgi:uncharacterized FlaG/YvyC family protein
MTDSLTGIPPAREAAIPAAVTPLSHGPVLLQPDGIPAPGQPSHVLPIPEPSPLTEISTALTASGEHTAEALSRQELEEALQKINLTFDLFEIAAEFSVSEDSGQIKVILRNTHTGEVVRRIPPNEFTRNFANFKDGLGLLFNRYF